MNKFKFSAYVPTEVYLEFTRRAREKYLHEKGSTRGAITKGIVEAMELWIKKEEDEK